MLAFLLYSSAGKPLGINLSIHFGIGKLSGDVPPLHLYFKAALPDNQHLVLEPILCTRVTISTSSVESMLRNIQGVIDMALWQWLDESLDAYVFMTPQLNNYLYLLILAMLFQAICILSMDHWLAISLADSTIMTEWKSRPWIMKPLNLTNDNCLYHIYLQIFWMLIQLRCRKIPTLVGR